MKIITWNAGGFGKLEKKAFMRILMWKPNVDMIMVQERKKKNSIKKILGSYGENGSKLGLGSFDR